MATTATLPIEDHWSRHDGHTLRRNPQLKAKPHTTVVADANRALKPGCFSELEQKYAMSLTKDRRLQPGMDEDLEKMQAQSKNSSRGGAWRSSSQTFSQTETHRYNTLRNPEQHAETQRFHLISGFNLKEKDVNCWRTYEYVPPENLHLLEQCHFKPSRGFFNARSLLARSSDLDARESGPAGCTFEMNFDKPTLPRMLAIRGRDLTRTDVAPPRGAFHLSDFMHALNVSHVTYDQLVFCAPSDVWQQWQFKVQVHVRRGSGSWIKLQQSKTLTVNDCLDEMHVPLTDLVDPVDQLRVYVSPVGNVASAQQQPLRFGVYVDDASSTSPASTSPASVSTSFNKKNSRRQHRDEEGDEMKVNINYTVISEPFDKQRWISESASKVYYKDSWEEPRPARVDRTNQMRRLVQEANRR